MECPPQDTAVVAEFLCDLAKTSRPKSVLHTASAALGSLYHTVGKYNVMKQPGTDRLLTGPVEGGTVIPLSRFSAMPVQKFHDFFVS